MSTLSSSFQGAVVGITAGTGALLHNTYTREQSRESWPEHKGRIYTATTKGHNTHGPLLLHSRIPLPPPGNRCRSAALRT